MGWGAFYICIYELFLQVSVTQVTVKALWPLLLWYIPRVIVLTANLRYMCTLWMILGRHKQINPSVCYTYCSCRKSNLPYHPLKIPMLIIFFYNNWWKWLSSAFHRMLQRRPLTFNQMFHKHACKIFLFSNWYTCKLLYAFIYFLFVVLLRRRRQSTIPLRRNVRSRFDTGFNRLGSSCPLWSLKKRRKKDMEG